MAQTTVFQSGNSQAVRPPKDFRFNTKAAQILRCGNEAVLREVPRTMGDSTQHVPIANELLDSSPPPGPRLHARHVKPCSVRTSSGSAYQSVDRRLSSGLMSI